MMNSNLKTMDPFLSFVSLAADVDHPKMQAVVDELCLHNLKIKDE